MYVYITFLKKKRISKRNDKEQEENAIYKTKRYSFIFFVKLILVDEWIDL